MIADAVVERATPLYLWTLEQNADARAFYESRGAVCVEPAPVEARGGVASRLSGTPTKLRYAWP